MEAWKLRPSSTHCLRSLLLAVSHSSYTGLITALDFLSRLRTLLKEYRSLSLTLFGNCCWRSRRIIRPGPDHCAAHGSAGKSAGATSGIADALFEKRNCLRGTLTAGTSCFGGHGMAINACLNLPLAPPPLPLAASAALSCSGVCSYLQRPYFFR